MTVAVRVAAEPTGSEAPAPAPTTPTTPNVQPTAPSGTPERPQWLPEKFKSAEDMVAAYKALETKLGVASTTTPTTPAEPVAAPVVAAEATAKAQGVDTAKLASEIAADGKPSEESLGKLKAAGFDDAWVNSYVEGQKALQATARTAMLKNIGGEAEFDKAAAWAKANLQKDELDAFNRAVASPDKASVQFAVEGLYSRYARANPSEPNLLHGSNGAGSDAFQSSAQVRAAMNDPRYANDPAFRAQVAARLKYSKVF